MAVVAFIGLGAMGFPMAGHLAAKGHEVRVFNRTRAKAEAWAARHSGRVCETPADAAAGAAFVVTCVGADPDVEAMFEAAMPASETGAVFIDHSTASAHLARDLHARAIAMGRAALDAPVSGGQAGAENGKLTIMAGGEAETVETARAVMSAYGASITHVGPAGAGQLAKMVNQICIAGVVQGLAEAVHFAESAGLNVETVIAAVSKGAAQSWQMENRWKTMSAREFAFGFAVDWMRKDLGLVLEEARSNGARAPLTALVDQFYADIQARGGGRWDTSSLITRFDNAD